MAAFIRLDYCLSYHLGRFGRGPRAALESKITYHVRGANLLSLGARLSENRGIAHGHLVHENGTSLWTNENLSGCTSNRSGIPQHAMPCDLVPGNSSEE